MEKFKKLKTSLIAVLLSAAAACSTAAFVPHIRPAGAAYADDKTYNIIDGNEVFYTSIRGAGINAHKVEGKFDDKYYTLFDIAEDQTVTYRQNLAYKWITGTKDENGSYGGLTETHRFSMDFAFTAFDKEGNAKDAFDFKRYIIKFQSQQYYSTEDERSENYLIFTPVNDGHDLKIEVAQSIEEDENGNLKNAEVFGTISMNQRVKFGFDSYSQGEYTLILKDTEGQTISDSTTQATFKNISENYASYSSGDKGVTPLTFSAEFKDGQTDTSAQMLLFDVNGQSFEMTSPKNDGNYVVTDNASPVMCFGKTPSYLTYGSTINLNYTVIDVLKSTPTQTAFYYVLTGEQYAATDFDYDKVDYTQKTESSDGDNKTEEGDKEEEKKQESPFIEASTSARLTSDQYTFVPVDYENGEKTDKYDNVYGLVKLYYEISDESRTSAKAKKDIVFVDWYVSEAEKESALVDIYDIKGGSGSSNFIKLIEEKPGATFATPNNKTKDDYIDSVKGFEQYYQGEIDKAIEKLDGEKLYAGGSKFYLPAIEWNFFDEYSTARDYTYSIYYKAKTSGSNTSLAPNKLAIDLNDADVTYRFTIFINDPMGNPMRYPDGIDTETGKIIWKEITTNDVWEEEFEELLPRFEVKVHYKEATAEDPKNLSLAYVGSSYSGVSFTIKGVSGMYTSGYKLYVFDRGSFVNDLIKLGIKNPVLEQETFEKHLTELFENKFEYEDKDGAKTKIENTRKYFTTVKAASQLLKSDVNYDKFKAINWNPTSVSFTPQGVEELYVVELALTNGPTQTTTKNYATVAASVQTTPLEGENDWLEKNKTSVILLSVSGACLVALIVLLVVKPKDKGDIDAVYTEVEGKGKKSKKNK
ncbi:MAG: hypothetical protein K2K39_01830 [Clostridia bacterium]|nr:hypothetical protein [Clostridia bacterium]